MEGKQSETWVYLVRHGEAKPKDESAERPLTESGAADVGRVATWAAGVEVRVDEIWHSGKLRAQQTAQIFAEHLNVKLLRVVSGLAPNDDVAQLATELQGVKGNIMLVGHLPFMGRLAARLVAGREEPGVASFRPGGMLCLERGEEGAWEIAWMLRPELTSV